MKHRRARRRAGDGWRRFVLAWVFLMPTTVGVSAQESGGSEKTEIHPLGLKEEMIRDRFQRFEDRVYRLREQLAETEPANAARLGRVLERSGELGLAESLDQIVELFRDASSLGQALDAQGAWLADANRVLAILLERDSDNEARKDQIERLKEFREQVQELLKQENDLRDATAQAAMTGRMLRQLEQAIARIESLLNRQADVSEATGRSAESGRPSPPQLSDRQQDLSRDTAQLSEDLERLGNSKPEEAADSEALKSARAGAQAAAEAARSAAGAMSEAGRQLQAGDTPSAGQQQEQATEALRRARERLEEAKRRLENQGQTKGLSEEQQQIARQTGDLSKRMQEGSGSGQQGQPGTPGQQGSSASGQQNLNQAQKEMNDAAQSLDESNPQEAMPSEEQAIEQLEQAQKELEEALSQLRKEQREEMLRDLEARFREMLSKQRAINDATIRLDQVGEESFKRAERLELSELAARQRALSEEAAVCVHILEEDGTTIVVPRVIGQVSKDMAAVADRLAEYRVGTLTQTIEREIVETLEQLVESVQRMQQENEQQGPSTAPDQNDNAPLLPPSAELRLLRASQLRINERTSAIEEGRSRQEESEAGLAEALQAVAERQIECAQIAEEMRARQR